MSPKPTKSPDAVLSIVSVVGSFVTFSTAGTKPAPSSKLTKFSMDYGDGSPVPITAGAPPATLSHAYAEISENYRATLQVWDKNRLTDSDTRVVSIVVDLPIPPPNLPVDCVLSEWMLQSATAWGPCQSDGMQTRTETWTRHVITAPANGGAACGSQIEQRIGTQACVYVPPVQPPVSTTHPRWCVAPAGSAQLPTIASFQAQFGTGGSLHIEFQACVDLYCRTKANGGLLDCYVSDGWPHEPGFLAYGLLIATYPVAGIDYRDAYSRAELEITYRQLSAIYSQYFTGAPSFALGFDLGFNVLTQAERLAGVDFFKKATTNDSSGGPIHHTRGVDRLNYHSVGYVYAGDGLDDAEASARIALKDANADGPGGLVGYYNHIAQSHGALVEGFAYSTGGGESIFYGPLNTTLQYLDGIRTATGDASVFAKDANPMVEFFPKIVSYLLAPYRPDWDHDGSAKPYLLHKSPESMDDVFGGAWHGISAGAPPWMFAWIAGRYAASDPEMAGLASWLQRELVTASGRIPFNSSVLSLRYGVLSNFFGNHSTAPIAPKGLLPLACQFRSGLTVVRDNWEFDGSGGVVQFIADQFRWLINGYGQGPLGTFSIHRNAPFIVMRGAGAHSAAQANTWGTNGWLFFDPASKPTDGWAWDYGGAIPVENLGSPPMSVADLVPGSKYDVGGITRSAIADGKPYAYQFADVTRAHAGPLHGDGHNTSKCARYERHFVRFRSTPQTSGFTVLCDRLQTTGPTIELRHPFSVASQVDPTIKTMVISGYDVKGTTIRDGVVSDHYDGRSGQIFGTVTIRDLYGLSGRLFWSPVFPADVRVVERGGPNAAGQIGQLDSREWEQPDGKIPGDSLAHSNAPWEGLYTYEFGPQAIIGTLQPIQVFEDCVNVDVPTRTPTDALTGINTRGVRIGNRFAFVAKDGPGELTSGDFVLTEPGTYGVLVADLPAAAPTTLTKGGNIGSVTVKANADDQAARTMWLEVIVLAAGSSAANRIAFI